MNQLTTALSNDQLRVMAPSIFAQHAHEKVSAKYQFIPTHEILDGLRSEGWIPVKAVQSRVNGEGPKGFQKHAITLRRDLKALNVGDAVIQCLLINSHDRSSGYQVHGGIFVLACSNGLMISEGSFDRISIRHMGHTATDVIDATYRIVAEAPAIGAKVKEMKATKLNEAQQLGLAGEALLLKYPDNAPISAQQLLTAHRYADNKSDLWSVFNRIQENVIGGGLRGRTATGRRMKTREVTAIGANVSLNKALWALAESRIA
jgi:hypothetical protein